MVITNSVYDFLNLLIFIFHNFNFFLEMNIILWLCLSKQWRTSAGWLIPRKRSLHQNSRPCVRIQLTELPQELLLIGTSIYCILRCRYCGPGCHGSHWGYLWWGRITLQRHIWSSLQVQRQTHRSFLSCIANGNRFMKTIQNKEVDCPGAWANHLECCANTSI